MPWNGKRKLKPLFIAERCLCSQCDGTCPDPVEFGVRCDGCHFFMVTGRHEATFNWEFYCRSTHSVEAHGDPRGLCSSREEHHARLAEEGRALSGLIQTLPHAMAVGSDRKWGQMTFEELV